VAANGYALMDYSLDGERQSSASLGAVLEPESPLMAGVLSLNALLAFRSSNAVTASAVVDAQWGDDEEQVPLVLHGKRGSRTLVELNFLPVPSLGDMNGGFFFPSWTGDGAALMRNALKYSRCMPPVSESTCEPGTFADGACPRLYLPSS
jgi:hypothetical protein